MNFEDQQGRGLGKFTSGTSTGRFLAAILIAIILIIGIIIQQHRTKEEKNPVDLVNPLMGTDSEYKLSNGNTYPAIALPWGMNF